MKLSLLLLSLLFLNSCHKKQIEKRNICAKIEDKYIYMNEIDSTIEKELYTTLFQLYLTRYNKLDEIINDKLIKLEASKKGYSTTTFLEIITKKTLINKSNEDNKQQIISLFIDSLKHVYNIDYYLQSPKLPLKYVNQIKRYYRGNLESQNTLWIISDSQCDMCILAKPILDYIYSKYKNEIKFAYSDYSAEISLSSIILECAGNQNKYWEIYEYLYNNKNKSITQTDILNIAKKFKLNHAQLQYDINSNSTKQNILNNFRKIANLEIFTTPTFILNNHIIVVSSKEQLENEIKKIILK